MYLRTTHETATDLSPYSVHTFTFPEVALGSSSNQQPYFRAMIFFNKKPGLTDEFFHEHWKSVHADLTMRVEGAGVKLVRYSQVSWGDKVWCGGHN
jgi:hypothetical protein